jgi:hypothetical protein
MPGRSTPPFRRLNVRIDKLTKSIEIRASGETFDTIVEKLSSSDTRLLESAAWQFDWSQELHSRDREVYKLTTIENPTIIQGLISLEDRGDHIFVHLIESAEFNKGRQKLYVGVPGNLFAFACKHSFAKGYHGFVAFDSKSKLISHYEKSLGAKRLSGIRMFIHAGEAYDLVRRYFKDFDDGTI